MAEKTERASHKKLLDARKQGRVAQSTDLRSALTFALVILAMVWALPWVWGYCREALVWLLRQAVVAPQGLRPEILALHTTLFWLLLAVWLCLVSALVVHLVWLIQTGGVASFGLVAPDISRVNPLSGLRRIFCFRSVTTALFALFKIGLMAWVAVWATRHFLYQSPRYMDAASPLALQLMTEPTVQMLEGVAAIVVVLGMLDQLLQHFLFQRDMRQDRVEHRRDMKDMEGDPMQKSQRRTIAIQNLYLPMPQAIAQASVMVTNPTHLAVLLRYAPEDDAPVPMVTYKAQGDAVRSMRRLAEAQGLAVLEWPPLARRLYAQVQIGDPVPAALFDAVAQVLIWARELKAG